VSPRRRLDLALVERGLARDVDHASDLVAQGRVLVGGAPAMHPGRAVAPGEALRVVEPKRYVGRGGEKLDGALDALGVDVHGSIALDVGASTGGFTDCLLTRGAVRVLAVDVGRGQLHERLAHDDRVVAMEATNVLSLSAEEVSLALGQPPDVVTMDLSFTSLTGVAPHVVGLAAPTAKLVVLVKPQFEADYTTVARGKGVVSDAQVWHDVLVRCASAIEDAGAGIMGVVASPLKGAAGNVEFFLRADLGGAPATREGIEHHAGQAIAEALSR
jgi:23S rRNA (cytidine1920-2'-O)/16S rRNA (cytidine1409-2'-O)-methyltransferase